MTHGLLRIPSHSPEEEKVSGTVYCEMVAPDLDAWILSVWTGKNLTSFGLNNRHEIVGSHIAAVLSSFGQRQLAFIAFADSTVVRYIA